MRLSWRTKDRLLMAGFILFFIVCLISGIGWAILEVLTRIRFITEGAC